MADGNQSRDVNVHGEHSSGTSRPPLPRPDNGDNYRPVPLWEREFCHNAYNVPWETFCGNKRFIALYKNVMDWDDSGALKNFEDAKERFRARYYGEPFEDPVLDPNMYIDEVDHLCNAHTYCATNNRNYNFHGGGSSTNWRQQQVDPGQTSSGTGRKLIGGGTMWISGASSGGATKWTGGGAGGNGNGRNLNGGSGSGGGAGGNGNGRNLNGGSGSGGGNGRNGGGGGGGGRNWNCFGGSSGSGRNSNGGSSKQRNHDKGQHQQRINGGGLQRNQDEGRHQMRSGGGQQQGQWGRKMEWRQVQHKRAPPKDDPAA